MLDAPPEPLLLPVLEASPDPLLLPVVEASPAPPLLPDDDELLVAPPPSVPNGRPTSKQPRSGAVPLKGSPTLVPFAMSGLFAASRRKGSTGRLPSA